METFLPVYPSGGKRVASPIITAPKMLVSQSLPTPTDSVDAITIGAAAAKTYTGVKRAAWALGAIMLLLIAAFDLGPPLAFNDDWGFAWTVRHFNPLHPHIYPSDSALALVQTYWAWLVTVGNHDQRLLRLSILPFVLLAMYALSRLARRMGADRTWAAVAAITPLAFPVFSADATSFMTDVPYVALLLMAGLGAVGWLEGSGKRWIVLCVAFATLATLQRQTGGMIPVAVTAALWLRQRHWWSWVRSDWLGLACLWGACLGAIVLPFATGISTQTQGSRIVSAFATNPIYFLTDLLFLPGMIGLGLVLFLPGLAFDSMPPVGWKRMKPWIVRLVIALLVVLILTGEIFPGNVFTPFGFASTVDQDKMGLKPTLLPPLAFFAIEVVALAAFVAFARRWHDWWPSVTGRGGLTLLLLAASQAMPLLLVHYTAFDRYYIPLVLLLAPMAARAASQTRAPVLAGRLALLLMAASTLLYVAGEQDYQAWQVARNNAACLAYQYATADEVYAGYEAMAVYVELPYYDKHGVVLGGAAVPNSTTYFSLAGPVKPIFSIRFAPAGDPRAGYSYSSLSPAKLVVLHGVNGQGLGISVPSGAPVCPVAG